MNLNVFDLVVEHKMKSNFAIETQLKMFNFQKCSVEFFK